MSHFNYTLIEAKIIDDNDVIAAFMQNFSVRFISDKLLLHLYKIVSGHISAVCRRFPSKLLAEFL